MNDVVNAVANHVRQEFPAYLVEMCYVCSDRYFVVRPYRDSKGALIVVNDRQPFIKWQTSRKVLSEEYWFEHPLPDLADPTFFDELNKVLAGPVAAFNRTL